MTWRARAFRIRTRGAYDSRGTEGFLATGRPHPQRGHDSRAVSGLSQSGRTVRSSMHASPQRGSAPSLAWPTAPGIDGRNTLTCACASRPQICVAHDGQDRPGARPWTLPQACAVAHARPPGPQGTEGGRPPSLRHSCAAHPGAFRAAGHFDCARLALSLPATFRPAGRPRGKETLWVCHCLPVRRLLKIRNLSLLTPQPSLVLPAPIVVPDCIASRFSGCPQARSAKLGRGHHRVEGCRAHHGQAPCHVGPGAGSALGFDCLTHSRPGDLSTVDAL